MRLPITISLYIGKQFLIGIGTVLAVLVGLIITVDFLEIIRRSYSKEVPFGTVLDMVFLKLPGMIQEVMPFAILLGGILAFSRLTRSSELVVARASGVSARQFLLPAIMIAFSIGVLLVTVFSPLSATMLSKFERIEAKYLKGNTSMLSVSESGLWFREREDGGGKRIIHALRITQEDMKFYDVTFFVYDDNNTFVKRIDAESAFLKDGMWELSEVTVAAPLRVAKNYNNLQFSTELSIHQIQDSFASPETLSFWQLNSFIDTLQEAGFSAIRHSLYFQKLLALPFLFSVMVLFAAAFSLRSPRHGKTGFIMAMGIMVGFVVYFLIDLVSAFGLSGAIPVYMAAWIPVLVSGLVGMALLLHLEES